VIPQVLAKQGWSMRLVLQTLAITAAGFAATWDAWIDMWQIATHDDEASHALLVPFIAVWMVWVRQARLLRCPPGGGIVGTAIIIVGWALAAFGYQNSVQSLWHFGSLLVVIGAALSVMGKYVLFQFLPAFLVLAFLVPVPGRLREAISIPLQAASASATHALLEVLGIDTDLNQNTLSINGMSVAVAEACNGMRMVFALVLVSYAFAFGTPLRGYVRTIIVLLSPFAALACNIPRLAATVLVYVYGGKATGDWFHEVAGWLMLPLAFLLLLAITRALRWALLPVERFTLAYQ
jgi:exosortase